MLKSFLKHYPNEENPSETPDKGRGQPDYINFSGNGPRGFGFFSGFDSPFYHFVIEHSTAEPIRTKLVYFR